MAATFVKDDGSRRKGIYHSDLAMHTAHAPQPIVLTAHPRNSKYTGKPKYCILRVPPDTMEYQLQIEHAGIEQVLAALPLNVPVEVQAHGSREAAVLSVVGAAPVAAPAQQQQQQPVPTRQQQEAGQPPLTHAYYHAFMAAHKVASKLLEDCGDTFARVTPGERLEFTRNIATSFFIQHQQQPDRPLSGGGNGQKRAPAPPAPPKPAPPPPPKPAPQPVPQSAAARAGSPFDDEDDDLPF